MTADTYVPQPGTIPARVIAHLKTLPAGTLLVSAVLAEALDVDADDLAPALKRAHEEGALVREAKGSLVRWGIGHSKVRSLGGPLPVNADDDEIDGAPIVQRIVPATQSSGVSLLDRPAWSPPKEAAMATLAPTTPQPKKARAAAPAFDPLAIELKRRPLPPAITSSASRYQALLERMQPGDSVDLPTAAAKSLVSAAKKVKVKLATRAIDETTTGVWRL